MTFLTIHKRMLMAAASWGVLALCDQYRHRGEVQRRVERDISMRGTSDVTDSEIALLAKI